MSVLQVVYYPDERLRKISQSVDVIDDKIKKIVMDMAETMYATDGVGLAAIQVGIPYKIFICDIAPAKEQGKELFVFINPEIIEKNGSIVWNEGCLSLPGIREDVKRFSHVKISALNLEGKRFELEGDELLAVCIQHENDHLNGILFIDHLSRLKRKFVIADYKKHFKEYLDEQNR